MSLLDNAIEAIKRGQRDNGRQMLEQALGEDESNEQIWLWMSVVVDSDDDREICLENVLALDPDNAIAKNALDDVRAGTFNPSDITGVEASPDVPVDDFSAMTFHDQFFHEDDDDLADDELEMPSIMGGNPAPKIKEQKKTAKKGFAVNRRLILIGVAVLLVCGGLGLAALFSFLGGGGTDGAGQDAPTAANEDAPPSDTPTPEPTPTVTNTPFVLPTAKPTDEPTPSATKVVSPTVVQPTDTPTPQG